MEGNELVAASRQFSAENRARSTWYVLSTFALLAAACAVAATAPWLPVRIAASVLQGLLIVRAFILSHDFQHGALLRRSKWGKALFTVYGLLVLTPPRAWRQTHNYHHANTAKIVGAQIGSYPVMTVEMWRRAPKGRRWMYAAARHPLNILFGYLTIFLFGMCLSSFVRKPKENYDSLIALLLHVGLVGGLTWFFGFDVAFFALVLPLIIACSFGAYLFYAQHNFPDIHIEPRQTWTFHRAALESSSYMRCGPVMSYFTGDIGLHHVHHLNASIPFYRLREAMAAIPALQVPPATSLHPRDIVACLKLKVWDPVAQRMVPFPEEPSPSA
ncbi:fatty acid desaturase family protein [Chondromyces apiculatus]|uniref:Fatty acid desaturase family protein n=1 Tax=Chondromyces apiculatus DSM 436 TaxID=1192034 RepID=A0A017SZE7_9BACT|nr:fatty acid desaturase [Chondromyces apiculatus]EYF02348.1 fatty acid desaturase family protein [Chondromyces apiculatus DSM 436]